MAKKTLLEDYYIKMSNIMQNMFPDIPKEELKKIINKTINEKKNNEPNFYFSKGNSKKKCSLLTIDKTLANDTPILDKSGVLYYKHSDRENILASMCAEFGRLRKQYKDQMFEHINDQDKFLFNIFDIFQRTVKILNNSFYGATTQGQSIFYHPEFGPSITYQGEAIIMTSISIFERSISNNITFYSLSDIMDYCDNIANEEYEVEYEITDDDIKINDKEFNIDNLIDYFIEHTDRSKYIFNKKSKSLLKEFLEKYPKEYLYKFYLKNNLIIFLDMIMDDFESVITKDFLDPNKPSEEIKDKLESIWISIKDYVFYNYLNYHNFDEAHERKRKCVLTVDTDSNFLYLKPVFNEFCKHYPSCSKDKNSITSTVSFITFFLTKIINMTYQKFTSSVNVEEDYRSLINMKNEFLLQRLMLTSNKKNYGSICLAQEGHIIDNPKVDIKGLPIKKVSVNKNVRNYYTEILENDILKADYIDRSKIIGKVFGLSDIIDESLHNGSTEYMLPLKVNEISSYKMPYNIMSLRGTILWNTLFKDQEISLPNKVNAVKIKIENDFEALENKLKENGFEEYIEPFKEVFENTQLFKSDIINIICMPKNIKEIPDVIKLFIDYNQMILDHLNSGMIILDSVNINTPKINDNLILSNIIRM